VGKGHSDAAVREIRTPSITVSDPPPTAHRDDALQCSIRSPFRVMAAAASGSRVNRPTIQPFGPWPKAAVSVEAVWHP
jgi:hypothetical protein